MVQSSSPPPLFWADIRRAGWPLSSATAVEQLLGRVLRQPGASHRQAKALNQSYAFVVSRNFAETAGALRDRLVAERYLAPSVTRRLIAEYAQRPARRGALACLTSTPCSPATRST